MSAYHLQVAPLSTSVIEEIAMSFNRSTNRSQLFTGFGLNEPKIEPDDDDLDGDLDDLPEAEEDYAADERALAMANGMTYDQLEDLWAGFSNRATTMNVCNVLVAILFFFGVHAALLATSRHLAAVDGPAQFRLYYQPIIWWILPGFGALILPWEITLRIWSLFAGSGKLHLYREWLRRETYISQSGAILKDSFGLYRWLVLLIVLPIAVGSLLALNMHSTLGADAIRECDYAFKPCKVLPYADVRRITSVARYTAGSGGGAVVEGASVVLDFKNAYRWTTADWGDPINDVDPAVAHFLTSKVNLTINTADRLKNIPPLSNQLLPAGK
ncbi:MAG: hypothetical protein ABSF70_13840 [Terracidiphilus sp.]